MNRVGAYFTYWEREWSAPIVSYLNKLSKLGFDSVEMSVVNLQGRSDAELHEVRDAAKDLGLELIFGLGFGPEADVSAPDKATRERGIAFAREQLRLVHEAGGHKFGGITYASWQHFPQDASEDFEGYLDRSVESVREICKTAVDLDVTYCVEAVNRYEGFLINHARDGVEFLKRVDSPAAGLLLDTFHMGIEEDSFYQAIQTAGSYLKHFHIGEFNRRAPGKGRMPWAEIFDGLRDAGYEGTIVMEPFIRPGGQVGRDIKVWRDLSLGAPESDMDSDMAAAAMFVKSMLQLRQTRS